ncbi:metalloregulator ArsR/SmtB family transcription factor [Phaeodactylibacter sp.]|uniref:ArsR/SmtB family transcription factor n=1 Tax=Phaeodactylibacter sp. TaxID=1940289 RepID=UPI0025F56372|nr:metalloregulator ArsR/SmtB family transcription factor [Phaeodactylibacter sp.]MCI5092682.1 metalloregulator ArsR/SmtB family transcription factor [Phaeodactylibacter sp.]
MKKDNNACIRIDRDAKQISRCKLKMEEVSTSVSDLSRTLSLAGNQVRMKIFILLQEEDRLCVCDLGEILEMEVPAISQHLRKMKDADLVQTQREGSTIYYYLTDKAKSLVQALFPFILVEAV